MDGLGCIALCALGGVVADSSVSVLSYPEVSSRCDFLSCSIGICDGLAWLSLDGLVMHLKWSCNDGCMVSMWNVLLSISGELLVFSLFPFIWLREVLSCLQGCGVGLLFLHLVAVVRCKCLLSAVPFFMLLIGFSIFSFNCSVDFLLPLGFIAGLAKLCLAATMNLAIFI